MFSLLKKTPEAKNYEILNLFDPQLQLINTKPVIENKLKDLLNELKSLHCRQFYS